MDFVVTKFFYKKHILEQNIKKENKTKNCPRKAKKGQNEQQHTKMFYIEKCLENYYRKIDAKINSFFNILH